jgi:dipeptidyl aminopeptidase/acylaminoacyl peptidase
MRSDKIKTLFFALLAFAFLNSCKDADDDVTGSDRTSYYISIGQFSTLNSAKNFRINLDMAITKQAIIQKVSDRSYMVLLGKYSSSYEAGKNAYSFYTKQLIEDYSIFKRGREVLDEFRNVLFVAKYQGRPSVYNLDLLAKKITVKWSRWGSKVVSLNCSYDRRVAFITAALAFGQRGGFPFIMDIRVLHLSREANEYEEMAQLGDGIQLYTYWEVQDSFKVNVSTIDSINSRIVKQKIFPFDLNGKLIRIVTRKYDILTNGFPLPPKRNPVYFSPNRRFQLRDAVFKNEHNFYIRDTQDKSEILVSTSSKKIADARWSEDGNFLFIVTQNITLNYGKRDLEPTGQLIVIDAVQKKQMNLFSGYRYGNILVHGNFLLFDERSNEVSKINILDYKKNIIHYTVSMPEGCGLNNLPLR